MKSHPDADGFIRSILANPADPTPRLIFADWLDDTGRPGNAAWAEYIRARVGMQQFNGGPYWQYTRLRHQADDVGQMLTASLTLSVGTLTRRLPDLFNLLPPHRFTVRLDEETLSQEVMFQLPLYIARPERVFPIWFEYPDARSAALATDRPTDPRLVLRLSAVFGRQVHLVAADPADLRRAIARSYGPDDPAEFFDPHVVLVDEIRLI